MAKLFRWSDVLEIRDSSIQGAGRGLFAKAPIPEGTWLDRYRGRILTKHEENVLRRKLNQTNCWLFAVPSASGRTAHTVDASGTGDENKIKFINTLRSADRNKDRDFNVEFKYDKVPRIWAVTTRPIAANEELFASYGPDSDTIISMGTQASSHVDFVPAAAQAMGDTERNESMSTSDPPPLSSRQWRHSDDNWLTTAAFHRIWFSMVQRLRYRGVSFDADLADWTGGKGHGLGLLKILLHRWLLQFGHGSWPLHPWQLAFRHIDVKIFDPHKWRVELVSPGSNAVNFDTVEPFALIPSSTPFFRRLNTRVVASVAASAVAPPIDTSVVTTSLSSGEIASISSDTLLSTRNSGVKRSRSVFEEEQHKQLQQDHDDIPHPICHRLAMPATSTVIQRDASGAVLSFMCVCAKMGSKRNLSSFPFCSRWCKLTYGQPEGGDGNQKNEDEEEQPKQIPETSPQSSHTIPKSLKHHTSIAKKAHTAPFGISSTHTDSVSAGAQVVTTTTADVVSVVMTHDNNRKCMHATLPIHPGDRSLVDIIQAFFQRQESSGHRDP